MADAKPVPAEASLVIKRLKSKPSARNLSIATILIVALVIGE